MEAIQKDKRYTYADYMTWDDDTRCELIDGVPYMMSAPSTEHQSILGELFRQLGNFLRGKSCRPFISPIDVRLNIEKGDNTVFQPDILVVCDHSKIDDKSINGAPDFIIEILSPSTASYDCIVKLNKYMEAGVREYWVVDPENKAVQVFLLKDGVRVADIAYDADDETAPVSILDGCTINLKDVFAK
jgi:Uma2 family endonuclease